MCDAAALFAGVAVDPLPAAELLDCGVRLATDTTPGAAWADGREAGLADCNACVGVPAEAPPTPLD